MRATPPECLGLLKTFEGFRPARNLDPAGYPEIGYGHRLLSGDALWDATLSEPEAEALALKDLAVGAAPLCDDLGTDLIAAMSSGQYAALLDFIYNLGFGRWRSSSLRGAVLDQNRWPDVPAHLAQWVYATVNGQKVQLEGLVRRRAAEAALWSQ